MKTKNAILVMAITLFSILGNSTNLSAQKAQKVLIVLTSHSDLGNTGNKTGFWLEEFADPYYLLIDNGIEVTLASPKGGLPPVDPTSASDKFQTEGTKRYKADKELQKLLSNTIKFKNIDASDYDAVFYPGGHGPLWDLAEDKNSIALLEEFFNSKKPIAVACHGPAIFKNTKKQDGTSLVNGLKVTGFSVSEETASGLKDVVPFMVEDMLKANGGIYSKGADWGPHVVVDGALITGQNPASAKGVTEKLLIQLKEMPRTFKKDKLIRRILGISPKLEEDGSYSPSKFTIKLGASKKSDYTSIDYTKYKGSKKKVLVILTEQKNMKMKNGKLFSTGNHPLEVLLPMMHLKNAGFEFEIATPTGKPAVLEMWAFPSKDKEVQAFYEEFKARFENPMKLKDFVDNSLTKKDSYALVFVPGGHGSMLGIPQDMNVGTVLKWAHTNDLFTISLCHGPGSFLATTLNNQKFIYEGYKMAVFPDAVDKKTPKFGYLPVEMPWELGAELTELGVTIVNTKNDKTVCVDRKLITGASNLASNELGIVAVKTLLKELK